jgi:hypothetical protein
VSDRNIGMVPFRFHPLDRFRELDPEARVLYFNGEPLDLIAVMNEVDDLLYRMRVADGDVQMPPDLAPIPVLELTLAACGSNTSDPQGAASPHTVSRG